MSDTSAVEYGDGYVEDPNFVPNVTDQFGTLDTSGTAGAAHAQIEEITPVFEVARKQNLAQAARALDPNDDSVDASMVTLPQGQVMTVVDEEKIKSDLQAKAEGADEPVQISAFRGPAQAAAAEEGPAAEAKAQAQTEQQGAGGGATDGGGSGGGATPADTEAEAKRREAEAAALEADKKSAEQREKDNQEKANAAAKKAEAASKKAAGN